MEKVRVFEADRKLKLAMTQMNRLKSERRVLRWSHFSLKLREKETNDLRLRQVRG